MRYLFKHQRKEVRVRFNRERLILAAMQSRDQLYFMMDTQFDGIYYTDAMERKKEYGENVLNISKMNLNMDMLNISYVTIEKMVDDLSKQKIAVFRKGLDVYVEIDCKDVVPGDMIFLSSGDIVPADVRIVYDKDFIVDQNLFIRSANNVRKSSSLNGFSCSMSSIADIPNICLMGCKVVGGLARAVAIGTGSATYLGKLIYGY